MATVNTSTFGVGVSIVGLEDTKRALRNAAPDLRKKMDSEIRAALSPVKSLAVANVPDVVLSGWRSGGAGVWSGRLGWDAAAARKGIAIRQGGSAGRAARQAGVRVAWKIVNTSAPGAVFELAGRRSSGSNANGQRFIAKINARHGGASRVIWSAWDSLGGDGRIQSSVASIVSAAEAELQARFDSASR